MPGEVSASAAAAIDLRAAAALGGGVLLGAAALARSLRSAALRLAGRQRRCGGPSAAGGFLRGWCAGSWRGESSGGRAGTCCRADLGASRRSGARCSSAASPPHRRSACKRDRFGKVEAEGRGASLACALWWVWLCKGKDLLFGMVCVSCGVPPCCRYLPTFTGESNRRKEKVKLSQSRPFELRVPHVRDLLCRLAEQCISPRLFFHFSKHCLIPLVFLLLNTCRRFC